MRQGTRPVTSLLSEKRPRAHAFDIQDAKRPMQHSTKDAPGQCETGHPMYLYLKKKNTNKRLRKMAFNAHAKSAERCITRHKRCPMAHREKTKQKSENESWVRSDIPSFCGRHYAAREKIDLVRAIAGLEKNEKEIRFCCLSILRPSIFALTLATRKRTREERVLCRKRNKE